jgi:hypothetical protein
MKQSGIESVFSEKESGEIERPHCPLSGNTESQFEARKGVVAVTCDKAPDAAGDLHRTFPIRALLSHIGPVMGEEMADGLFERGTVRMGIGIAEEPTHMRREAQPVVSMVDQTHQRLDFANDGDRIQDPDAVRKIGIQQLATPISARRSERSRSRTTSR